MYPNLYFFLKDVFGFEPWGFTRYINSFGLLVAIAFVIAALILKSELKRKENEGLLSPLEEKMIVGKPASFFELMLNFLFGFLVGYKITGVFFNDLGVSPQEYMFSAQGNPIGGLMLGGLFSWLRYSEKKKQSLPKPEERKVRIWPHERVGDITVYAAVAGFLGAKIFDNLENWDRFIQDPLGNLLSPSGLTFYGGLILATLVILIFARSKKIGIRHLIDAAAPALMIAYAIGRMGCHVSGDGDWGVFNSAYTVSNEGKIIEASENEFQLSLKKNPAFTGALVAEYGSIEKIPSLSFKGPDWSPNWFWAYHFPHNVNEVGVPITGCDGPYCNQLVPPVFPTTLYEIISCCLLFLFLWSLRKKIQVPGRLFAVYLFLNGMERFLIEKIRVNTTYSIWGFHPTQAELISSFLMIAGVYMWFHFSKMQTTSKR